MDEVVASTTWESATGTVSVPARSVAVLVDDQKTPPTGPGDGDGDGDGDGNGDGDGSGDGDDFDAWGTLSLSADRVEQGGSFTATVTGLEPGQKITATLHSDPLEISGIPAADASGRVSFEVVIPVDFALGEHTLVIESGSLTPLEGSITVVRAGELATTGAQAPWGWALGAVLVLVAGGALYATRRRGVFVAH